MKESKEYLRVVQDLKYWQEGQTFFTCQLFSLMKKADGSNFTKLAIAFPLEAKVFADWYHHENPTEFFEELLGKQWE